MHGNRIPELLRRIVAAHETFCLIAGLSIAASLLASASAAISIVGTPFAVVLGLTVVAGVSLDVADRMNRLVWTSGWRAVSAAVLMIWLIGLPILIEASLSLGALIPGVSGELTIGLLAGLASATVPLILVGIAASEIRNRTTLIGVAAGLAFVPLVLALVQHALAVAVVLCVAAGLAGAMHRGRLVVDMAGSESDASMQLPTIGALRLVGVALAGVSLVAMTQVFRQTVPTTAATVAGSGAWLVLGVIIARYGIKGRTVSFTAALFTLACGLTLAVGLFPELIRAQLWFNAGIVNTFVLALVRAATLGLVLLPVGFVIGTKRQSASVRPWTGTALGLGVLCGLLLPVFGITVVFATGSLVLLTLLLVLTVRFTQATGEGSRRFEWRHAAAAATVLTAAVLTLPRYCPERAARLLFSAGITNQFAAGAAFHQLFGFDDARLLSSRETPQGMLTTWRYRGSYVQLRRNGIPESLLSETDLCPQPSLTTLPALIPLLLHDRPEHVLFLGDAGPVAESVALVFPVRSVTTIDTDERTVEELDAGYASRTEDDRFRHIVATPAIGLERLDAKYDIIVSRPPEAALVSAASSYTTNYYQRAARRLTETGMFCQTFHHADFGPAPIRVLLRSARSAFETVALIQLDTNSILIVATNDTSVIRPGLAERTSREHVRRILDAIGWDWSRVLQMASCTPEAVDQLLAADVSPNTAAGSGFLWNLPLETMRWGNKQRELYEAFGGAQSSLLSQLPEDDFRAEATRRISEIAQEEEILAEFPDEPWIYRKTLQTRMKQHPRPSKEIVEKGRVRRHRHPLEQQRMDYLQTVAEASRATTDDLSPVRALDQFTNPTVPLVSRFARYEAARVYAALGNAPQELLRHRLHTIYFSPSGNRSVRDVSATITLLVDHPELIADDRDRFDQLNSLLQVLMQRWAARSRFNPRSTSMALNDIEKCLVAIDRGMDALGRWREAAGVSVAESESRAGYLRRRLERPLKRYRQKLQPHHQEYLESMASDEMPSGNFRPLGN